MDYHHRLSRYGQEIADKKRPNPFTFEIWDFMQEAKKTCRSEAMEGVDYSKVQLALEDGVPDGVSLESDDENNDWFVGTTVLYLQLNYKSQFYRFQAKSITEHVRSRNQR